MQSPSYSYLAVDEHGRFLQNEQRITDLDRLQILLDNLQFTDTGTLVTEIDDEHFIVEAFEAPWIIVDLQIEDSKLVGHNTYGFKTTLDLNTCYFDEWDKLHGLNEKRIPWALNRAAQEKFFDLLEEFDDESFTLQGRRIETQPPFLTEDGFRTPEKWSEIYKEMPIPNWDLQQPHPAFVDMLPRLKQPRSRILILGCGEGHDAAFFAEEGHIVTAVDFSDVALDRARKKYGHLSIQFVHADAFKLPHNFDKSFDVVIEHTHYCAIDPYRRSQLVQVWNRCLIQGGLLMGVFFSTEKRSGPPYGSTEWEIRQRLQKDYHFLFWGRWKNSPPQRQGRELFILAQKK